MIQPKSSATILAKPSLGNIESQDTRCGLK